MVLSNRSEEPKTPPKGTLTLCMSLKVLKEKNVKGIAVNVPGHAFTSGDPLRRMGEWAESDVEPVLEAEGVPKDAPLIVEGSSFGSAHAHSVMHYFQDRIATIHFQVPALSCEVAKEYKLAKISEGGSCMGTYSTTCFCKPGNCCSPCLYCCCVCCLPFLTTGSEGHLRGQEGWKEMEAEHQIDAVKIMVDHNVKHSYAASVHGLVYNFYLGQLYNKWGFHPFDDIKVTNVEKMKIMVSYGENDKSSPESHGEYMAKFYSEKCNQDGKLFKNVLYQR